jgi:hypothetical protein
MTAGQPTPLPVRARPRRGETADSYLRRLAAANHLRFSYLRRYLARSQGSCGPVDPGRLAALAGRELTAILRALPELATAARPPARRYTQEDIQRNYAAKREKYAAIRRDAGSGMSERAIERKHHVGRRTIIRALAFAEPPGRKKIHREPAALEGLHGHIDAMLEATRRSPPRRSGNASPTSTPLPSPTRHSAHTSPAAVLSGKHLARKATADLPSSPWRAQVLTAA